MVRGALDGSRRKVDEADETGHSEDRKKYCYCSGSEYAKCLVATEREELDRLMGWPTECRTTLFLVSAKGHQSEDNSKNEEEDSGRDFHVRLSLLFAVNSGFVCAHCQFD